MKTGLSLILLSVGFAFLSIKAQEIPASNIPVSGLSTSRTVFFSITDEGGRLPIVRGVDTGGWTNHDIWEISKRYFDAKINLLNNMN